MKDTHKLIIRIGFDQELVYTASSFTAASELYNAIKEKLATPAWGFAIVPIKDLGVN